MYNLQRKEAFVSASKEFSWTKKFHLISLLYNRELHPTMICNLVIKFEVAFKLLTLQPANFLNETRTWQTENKLASSLRNRTVRTRNLSNL
jgi:hypothetical protein